VNCNSVMLEFRYSKILYGTKYSSDKTFTVTLPLLNCGKKKFYSSRPSPVLENGMLAML